MKGRLSGQDEKKLSFQIASIDLAARTMTIREVLWNARPGDPISSISWGNSRTVALAPQARSSLR
jgi:hypothetical protein